MPLSLNGVSAWVEVDGKELEQYGVEEDIEHNQVTCWIATQVDKVGQLSEVHASFLPLATPRAFPSCSGMIRFTGTTRFVLLSNSMGQMSVEKPFTHQLGC